MKDYTNKAVSDQIYNGMGFHLGTAETAPLYSFLKNKFILLADDVNAAVPDGRDKSLAITHLEDALTRALRGIDINLAPLSDERA